MENQIPVLVLQHPGEVEHAKGTVRLLDLSLAHCEVRVGEVFCADELCLGALDDAALLYPEISSPGCFASVTTLPGALSRLVVLDGTWRKTYRMLCRNPWLRALTRLNLPAAPISRYRVRMRPAKSS